MTKTPARVARLARPHLRRSPTAWAAVIVMAGAGLAWAGHAAWQAIQTWGMNMVAMGGPSGWRMNIGTEISPGSPAPPPAAASPLS